MARQRIVQVEAGGIAQGLGVRPGDVLTAINGKPVVDLIDYQTFTCHRHLTLDLERQGQPYRVACAKDPYAPLGLGFEQMLMSPQRNCVNHCLFCFVDQLPAQARASLRVKDDDWRMSLMMGNFVTLTNVSDRELERIIRRRCAPLYISVHATDPQLRARMLGQPRGARIMEQLRALAQAGLSFHTQAVLCPGINDGAQLQRTMEELEALGPQALSLALVPVGLTGHREGLYPLRGFTREEARRVLDQAQAMAQGCLKRRGDPFVYPADEFYLLAGRDFPPDEAYGEYPQIENGVGLCRLLQAQYSRAWQEGGLDRARPGSAAVACGVAVAPFLRQMLAAMPVPGVQVQVYPVENRFFGPSVTVSGLLTGSDLMRAMAGVRCDRLLISQAMLREGEHVFLDGATLEQVRDALGVELIAVTDGQGLLEALAGIG